MLMKYFFTVFIILFFFSLIKGEYFYYLENGQKISLETGDKGAGKKLYLTGDITVKTDSFNNLEIMKRIALKKGGKLNNTTCRNEVCYTTFTSPENSNPFDFSNLLHRYAPVKWVQPDYKIRVRVLSISNDPFVQHQWHLPMINAAKGWKHSRGEPYSIIGVLDTGVSIHHPDLKENIIMGKSFAKNPETGVSPLEDATGYYYNLIAAHGTAVAGILGASVDNWEGGAGVCGNCSVMPVKFFDYNENLISVSRVLNAFKWMVDNGASVINNSWGEVDVDDKNNCIPIEQDNYRNEAVNYAAEYGRGGLGTVVVWAAGNSGCDTAYNMNYNNHSILVTGAINKDNRLATYSNYGNRIDIVLPDASFTTDIPGPKGMNNHVFADFKNLDYTASFTGTSASASVASGIAGLIISVNPLLKSEEVIKCMKMAASLPNASCDIGESERKSLGIKSDPDKEHSKCYGFGVVDVEKALIFAKDGSCGKPYEGCLVNNECPVHFKCDKNSGKCVENHSDPLPRYDRKISSGCSFLFLN